MIEFNNFHQAIIVSGDGDFHCLVKYLLRHDKFFKLFIPNRLKYSTLLRRLLNSRFKIFLEDLEKKLKIPNKSGF